MITACALLLLSAAASKKCTPLPPPGQWFHLSAKNGPRPGEREPDPVPIRRPIVMAAQGGLLVLTPHGGGRYRLCSNTWERIGPVIERAVDYGLPEPIVSEKELFFVGLASPQKLAKPLTKRHHVVNGTPMLVGYSYPSEGSWAGPGATFYPATSCQPGLLAVGRPHHGQPRGRRPMPKHPGQQRLRPGRHFDRSTSG